MVFVFFFFPQADEGNSHVKVYIICHVVAWNWLRSTALAENLSLVPHTHLEPFSII